MTNLSSDHRQVLKASIVRIYNNYNEVVGAGFLVAKKYMLTCAHVITEALGISDDTLEIPTTPIRLDFPLVAPGENLMARVVLWEPVSSSKLVEDIAGLEISQDSHLPSNAQPTSLVNPENVKGHSASIFGFLHHEGVWASATLIDKNTKWLQMEDFKVPGYKIESGFSGAPVWDEELRGVVGMVVAAEKHRENTKVAFLIPSSTLQQAWPQLNKILTTSQLELTFAEQGDSIYVERPPIEREACEAILKPGSGSLIRIKAPRQMGKTLLLNKILDNVKHRGFNTAIINCDAPTIEEYQDYEKLCQRFCFNVGEAFNFPASIIETWLDKNWKKRRGINSNATYFLNDFVIEKTPKNSQFILVFKKFDEILVRDNLRDNFCKLLRDWFEQSRQENSTSANFKNLHLILSYSTHVYSFIKDIHTSPFNIGDYFEPKMFNDQQIQEFIMKSNLTLTIEQIEKIKNLIGGHPFLLGELVKNLKTKPQSLENLLKEATTRKGIFYAHLSALSKILNENDDLKQMYKIVINSEKPINLSSQESIAFRLESLGLIKIDEQDGDLVSSSLDLYKIYFKKKI